MDEETVIALFIKILNIFDYAIFQYDRNAAYTMSFNLSETPEGVLHYRNIKGDANYMHGEIKAWN